VYPAAHRPKLIAALGALLACSGWTPGACAQTASARTLLVTRNDKEIGTETISIERQAQRLVVSLAVHLQVKMLGMTVYRFDQDSAETWSGDRLERLTSQTSDNGTRHRISVSRRAAVLEMQADQSSSSIAETTLPGSQWYEPHFANATLIHNVDGRLLHVTAQRLGTETLRLGETQIEARHYRFSGDVTDDFWFDSDGVLVKRRLTASDHSVIEFRWAPKLNVASAGTARLQ
jgi:hypothetical protein